MSILVVADHDNNEIKGSTLNTVTAASEIGGEVSVLSLIHISEPTRPY